MLSCLKGPRILTGTRAPPTLNAALHLTIIREIFVLAWKYELKLRFDKCSPLNLEITFLGYKIGEQGIKPSEEHVEAIANIPDPNTVQILHQFILVTSYFRRFIQDFSVIAKPLYEAIRRVKFTFGSDETDAFETLKNWMSSSPVLAVYFPKLETQLHCDASASVFGAIMMQKQENGIFKPV